jgi:hypothetical protein
MTKRGCSREGERATQPRIFRRAYLASVGLSRYSSRMIFLGDAPTIGKPAIMNVLQRVAGTGL